MVIYGSLINFKFTQKSENFKPFGIGVNFGKQIGFLHINRFHFVVYTLIITKSVSGILAVLLNV
jgi:hypothetical protein